MDNPRATRLPNITDFGKAGHYPLSDRARSVSRAGMNDLANRLVDHDHIVIDMDQRQFHRRIRRKLVERVENRVVDLKLLAGCYSL